MRARTIGSRHRRLLRRFGKSGEGCVGLVVDGQCERRALDRRRTGDRLDGRLGPAVGQAEREAAEGGINLERRPDLLEKNIEGSVTRRRIAFLDVDLDLDRVLVVRASEATESLLRASGPPRGATVRLVEARTAAARAGAPETCLA